MPSPRTARAIAAVFTVVCVVLICKAALTDLPKAHKPPKPAPEISAAHALWPKEVEYLGRTWKRSGDPQTKVHGLYAECGYTSGGDAFVWGIARWPMSREVVWNATERLYAGDWPRETK